MEGLKQLIEDLGRAFEEFRGENDRRIKAIEAKGSVDPLLTEKVEKINAEMGTMVATKKNFEAMKAQLEAIETAVARAEFPGGGRTEKNPDKAAHAKAFDRWFRKGVSDGLMDLQIKASASTLSDPDGGFTVPEEVDSAIDRVAQTMSAMRRLCTVRSISTDTYKKLVNQGGASSGWVAEKASRAETNTPTLAEIAINTKEIYAQPAATQTLLDDSAIDIGGWLADEVGIEFNEQEGDSFIHGNGVEKPKGIAGYTMIANSGYSWGKVGFTVSGHATLLNNADKLIDLQHSLKAIYRGSSAWLMNDITFSVLRKFKDGEGNYLWRPGLQEGQSDTLLGKPVEIDDNVDDIGAGKFPVFFANFKRAYLIIDRLGTRVLRDPYTSKPFVLFYTTKRVGGGIVMYEAIKALKISA
jgi:HK97 family phage major capsid protein